MKILFQGGIITMQKRTIMMTKIYCAGWDDHETVGVPAPPPTTK